MTTQLKFNQEIILSLITGFFSISICLVICELFLRFVPIPGIEMRSAIEFDSDVNLYTYAPNTRILKWNGRKELIKRKVNSKGYLDSEHVTEKPKNIYRIGFFGDSYVEASQVALENTFFKIIEKNLRDFKINAETLAFGTTGHGTIHSYLKSKKYTPYYNLDMVVYVFCENDLGDQIEEIKQADFLPYVNLIHDQLIIDYEATIKSRNKYSWGPVKTFFYSNSILFQNISRRLTLIKRYGIKITVNKNEIGMATKSSRQTIPNQNDLPSSWPEFYRSKAMLLGEKVIALWSNEIKSQGKRFAILYIPRETEWQKDTTDQDSWKNWLKEYCKKLDIDFIDPAESFITMYTIGKAVYDGHFSIYGHQAFAEAFVKWFANNNDLNNLTSRYSFPR
jgi:hypothetical protein